MAIAIPEAAEAVTAGEGALGEASAGARAGAGGGAPAAGKKSQPLPGLPGAPGGGGKAKAKKRGGGRGRAGQYQPVILAEFLVAVLVIAIPPLATGGDKTAKAKGAPSPYSTDTLKQLIAVGAVYFILALLSGSAKLGRFTGWFGGLVLLGTGLIQVANGDLTALFKIFGPAGPNPAEVAADQPQGAADVAGLVGGTFAPVPDATGLFPVIGPGGQVTTVSPPPGGTGVTTTTGSDAGANLASQVIGGTL